MNLKAIFNWIFPSKCLVCNCETYENAVFCPTCFAKITFIDYPFCQCCGKFLETSMDPSELCATCQSSPHSFDLARALFKYDFTSKKLIMKIKNEADSDITKSCAKLLYSRYSALFKEVDFIIPVPSHWTRVLSRGYNPPDLIASGLSKISKIPVCNALKRTRKTPKQKNKTRAERIRNVKNAFSARNPDKLQNKTVILVDDVFTTGATLSSCCQTLKNSNVKKIICMTIATT